VDEAKAELPKITFDPTKWVSWYNSVANYLSSVRGQNKVPLIYVIRKDRKEGVPFVSSEEERIYSIVRSGLQYEADNKTVYRILADLLSTTKGWIWISRFDKKKDGRAAMEALRKHYDGPSERVIRTAQARQAIADAHYESEKRFTFEKYVATLADAFEVLEDHDMPKTEDEKVDIMLAGMSSDNVQVAACCSTIRVMPELRMSFQMAADRLMELIGSITPRNTVNSNRGIAASKAYYGQEGGRGYGHEGRGATGRGRGNGGGRGRGGRGRGRGDYHSQSNSYEEGANAMQGGQRFNNDIDISDLTRYFPEAEWYQLDRHIQDEIRSARESQRSQANKRKVASISSNNEQPDASNSGLQQQNEVGGPRDHESCPSNGISFGSGAYSQLTRKR
jgi:hypothetical protein